MEKTPAPPERIVVARVSAPAGVAPVQCKTILAFAHRPVPATDRKTRNFGPAVPEGGLVLVERRPAL